MTQPTILMSGITKPTITATMGGLIQELASAILENRPEELDGGNQRCGSPRAYFWFGIERTKTPAGVERQLKCYEPYGHNRQEPNGFRGTLVCDFYQALSGVRRAQFLTALIEYGWEYLRAF